MKAPSTAPVPVASSALAFLRSVSVCATLVLIGACSGNTGPAATPAPAPVSTGVVTGAPTASALGALPDVAPRAADVADIDGTLLLTRLSVVLRPDATVEQLNAAAQEVGATGFAFARKNSPYLALAVPRQANGAALQTLAASLRGQAGILVAVAGRQFATKDLPADSNGTPVSPGELDHLLATRFPAAWNVRALAQHDCASRQVTVLVPDYYFGLPTAAFSTQVPNSLGTLIPLSPLNGSAGNPHGYDVVSILGAQFDDSAPTGANPLPECLNWVPVDLTGQDAFAAVDTVLSAVASTAGKAVMNASFGFEIAYCGPNHADPCASGDIDAALAPLLQEQIGVRFLAGIQWAEFAMQPGVLEDKLIVQAAGNEHVTSAEHGALGELYAGFSSARLGSPFAIATQLASVQGLAADPNLWTTTAVGLPPLMLDANASGLLHDLFTSRVSDPISESNLSVVGSTTNRALLADLRSSAFSNPGADLNAVGEALTGLDLKILNGTSFAAPQVAGLASYLWLLDDGLRAAPVAETLKLIRATARRTASVSGVVDAYAAVLALDARNHNMRIRKALLDVNGDGVFDGLDLVKFADAYGLSNPGTPTIPSSRDYSRFDLNGDGATGGITTEAFDLDAAGLDANGAPGIGAVGATVEGYNVSFSEAALSDVQILCYYAYATQPDGTPLLYDSGQTAIAERSRILGAEQCVRAQMSIALPAQLSGSTNVPVTVQVPAGNGPLAPAPNVLIELTPTCGSVSPSSGRTDPTGTLVVNITPNAGCTTVALDVIARADPGTTPLSRQSVTAQVTAVGRVYSGTLTRTTSSSGGGGSTNSLTTVSIAMQSDANGDLHLIGASGTFSLSITSVVPCNKPPDMTPSTLTLSQSITNTLSGSSSGAKFAGSISTGVSFVPIVIGSSAVLETQDTSQRFPDPAIYNDCLKIVASSSDAARVQATFSGVPVVDSTGNVIGFDFSVPAHDETQPNGVVVTVSVDGVLH